MDNYIHCKDALDAVESLPGTIPSGDPVIDVICKTITSRLVDLVSKIPSADVAPVVHGRWEHTQYNEYRCNQCGRFVYAETEYPDEEYPYCHCGAKMGLEVK